MQNEYDFVTATDGVTYSIKDDPTHQDLPDNMVCATGIPVSEDGICVGESKMLVWIDKYCADSAPMFQAVALPMQTQVDQKTADEIREALIPQYDYDTVLARNAELSFALRNGMYDDSFEKERLEREQEHTLVLLRYYDSKNSEY